MSTLTQPEPGTGAAQTAAGQRINGFPALWSPAAACSLGVYESEPAISMWHVGINKSGGHWRHLQTCCQNFFHAAPGPACDSVTVDPSALAPRRGDVIPVSVTHSITDSLSPPEPKLGSDDGSLPVNVSIPELLVTPSPER